MSTNKFSIVDIDNENDELQFQDFGLSEGSRGAGIGPSNNFTDSAGHQTDSQKDCHSPQRKRGKYSASSTTESKSEEQKTPVDQPSSRQKSKPTLNLDEMENFSPSTDQFDSREIELSDSSNFLLHVNSIHCPSNKDIFAGENHQKLVSESKNLHSIVSKAAVTAILSDDVHSTIELAYALLLRVQDKSLVSKAVKNLAASWPVPELQHLKRVKKFPKISKYVGVIEEFVSQASAIPEDRGKTKCHSYFSTENSRVSNQEKGPENDVFFVYVDLLYTFIEQENNHDIFTDSSSHDSLLLTNAEMNKFKSTCIELNLPKPIASNEVVHVIRQKLSFRGVDLSLFSPVLYVGKVSKYAPRLRYQFETVTAHWPCSFHEDEYLAKLIRGDNFTGDEVQSILKYMNLALCLAYGYDDGVDRKEMKNSSTCNVMPPAKIPDAARDRCESHLCSSCSGVFTNREKCCVQLSKATATCTSTFDSSVKTSREFPSCSSSSGNYNLTRCTVAENMEISSNGSKFHCKHHLPPRSACLMVDSSRDRVVVQVRDLRDVHPLAHAAMVAVDHVARTLGGGCWQSLDERRLANVPRSPQVSSIPVDERDNRRTSNLDEQDDRNTSNLEEQDDRKKSNLNEQDDRNIPNLNEQDDRNIPNLNEQDDRNIPNLSESERNKGPHSAKKHVNFAAASLKLSSPTTLHSDEASRSCNSNSHAPGPSESDECTSSYICTGLDAYLSHEPCMMCAMALLHSRVQRVFYHHRNAEKGALGSVVKLHTLPNINHRYEVFNVTAVEDC
ncbi:uncharacterized protein LOC108680911 isoform X1 [Hyalella azteca]|uniref:Uncharacterized protein LOC108680911 isoform X1 n=1 Tax=Hyalella azteca TaxID=294128 RepID=A0A8B7PJ07_HYAAZ|nr:uncharacterized protein LOC108680911 isoform X1 [Hyalella azteca]